MAEPKAKGHDDCCDEGFYCSTVDTDWQNIRSTKCDGCKYTVGIFSKECCKTDCEDCKKKCHARKARGIKEGETDKCVCRNCNCGCGYGLCNCCNWCARSSCPGGPCDGFIISRRSDYKNPDDYKCRNGHCEGHFPNGGKYFKAQYFEDGKCIGKCTDCGTYCFQGIYYIVGLVLVPFLIVLVIMFIIWAMFPEMFQRMKTGMRAAFSSSSGRTAISLSNPIGDRITEEINNEKYPAFRPRA